MAELLTKFDSMTKDEKKDYFNECSENDMVILIQYRADDVVTLFD